MESIIGRRVTCKGYEHIRGTIIGRNGADFAFVEWDDLLSNGCIEPLTALNILDETVSVDDGYPD